MDAEKTLKPNILRMFDDVYKVIFKSESAEGHCR